MTSSLVGSEMCIRDSFTPDENGEGVFHRKASLLFVHDVPGLPGVKPVSYTHLTLPTICSV
eukprot:1495913-Prorocentrum_lima.AAC.1